MADENINVLQESVKADGAEQSNAAGTEQAPKSEVKETTFDDVLKNPKMQAEFDRRMAKAQQTREDNLKAEIEKAVTQRLEEQKKVAKMDAEQKAAYEREQLEKERDMLMAELTREKLGKLAAATLSKSGVEADEAVLGFVVGANEDETTANIEAFLSVVQKQVEAAEVRRNTGTTQHNYATEDSGPKDEFARLLAKYN